LTAITDAFGDGWMFVAGTNATADGGLINEALLAAPAGVRNAGEILPRRRPDIGVCRLCRTEGLLTREHVPPQSSGNNQRLLAHSVTEWLERDSLSEIPGGRYEQGGMWGYTLCGDCNSRTGRLSGEYRKWAGMASGFFANDLPPVDEMNSSPVSKGLTIQLKTAKPGLFVRQVLSLMCTAAGPWDLVGVHPELGSAVLDGTPSAFPSPLWLGMTLCGGPAALVAGPTAVINTDTQSWRWLSVVAYPPFAFELELASSPGYPPSQTCGIGDFLTVGEKATADVELDLFVGFTNTIFPGDWRAAAQIEQGLGLDGRPVI
jgi:hypothetical protein